MKVITFKKHRNSVATVLVFSRAGDALILLHVDDMFLMNKTRDEAQIIL